MHDIWEMLQGVVSNITQHFLAAISGKKRRKTSPYIRIYTIRSLAIKLSLILWRGTANVCHYAISRNYPRTL